MIDEKNIERIFVALDRQILGVLVEGEVRKMGRFPGWLIEAAARVAADFDLPADWLNLGPESQLDTGLPKGLTARLEKKTYGDRLTVFFISRVDQIHFKLYASLDRGGYHVQDLFRLGPASAELLEASRWVLTQDVSVGFKAILVSFLRQQGHEELAGKL